VKVGRKWTWVCATVLLALVMAACGSSRSTSTTAAPSGQGQAQVTPDPGITDTEIKIGSSYAFSGNTSFYGVISKMHQAYIKFLNEEKGGVKMGDGKTRKLTYTVYDDAYVPARMVENVKRLVEQDQVFTVFNTLGTPTNSAIWDYLNEQKVPQLFVATGASKWGDYQGHPWTIGWQPTYPSESKVYVEYLKKEKPNAKVAILYQNDDYGKDYQGAFEKAIAGTGITVVAKETYEATDPTVDSQVTNLSKTGADVFFNVSTPKFAAQAIKKVAELGWTPLHVLNGVSASIPSVLQPAGLDNSKGIVTSTYGKDPADPKYDSDPAMKEFKRIVAKYDSSLNPLDTLVAYGYGVMETLVKTLEGTKAPTRKALIDSARSISNFHPSLALDGVNVNTTATDAFPIEALQIENFDGKAFVLQGSVIDVSGK